MITTRVKVSIAACACAFAVLSPVSGGYAAEGDPGSTQTSEGVQGRMVEPRRPGLRRAAAMNISNSFQSAPGVQVQHWGERTSRGPVSGHLITVDLKTPGVSVDYAGATKVPRSEPLSTMLARRGAVAGVNGDFFDIGVTGAPLGAGADRRRGLIHASAQPVEPGRGEATFAISKSGRVLIGAATLQATVKNHPRWKLGAVNAPHIRPGEMGLYTEAWGRTPDSKVTDGNRGATMVEIRGGRVKRVWKKIRGDIKFNGKILIGRGKAAKQLRRMRPGKRLPVRIAGRKNLRMAISGNRALVTNSAITVVDDSELHPRTAVGIDRSNRRLILITIDGRSSASRGYTMVELAERMISLGADDALNLDGGGSSTMIARGPAGSTGVINDPSDGGQRSIPNGLAILSQ